ncbi:methylcytosine dioxygenase TET3-like isoform X2 [Lytechinus variegatus]|uniref:methylcytosine dioxygenase TET3-like isoform X2 n=1 Tax=Lytechinus variegatus TaxID=7654 RepID=UPI001BB2C4B0|nr:methylcytosine dioxygenase TET3-like isoform X2 [Lytechinus variegatus]
MICNKIEAVVGKGVKKIPTPKTQEERKAGTGAGQQPTGLVDVGAAVGSPRMKGVRPPSLATGGTDGQDMSKAQYLPNVPVSDGGAPPNQVVGKNGQVMQWNPAAPNPPSQQQMMNGYSEQYPHHLPNHHLPQHPPQPQQQPPPPQQPQAQPQLKGEDTPKIGQELSRKEALPKMPPGEPMPKTAKGMEGKPSKEHGLSAFSPTPDSVSKPRAPAHTPPGMARDLAERHYYEKMVQQQQQQQQQKLADPHEIAAAAAAAAAAAHRSIPPKNYPHHPHHLSMSHKPEMNNHAPSKKEAVPPGGSVAGTPVPPPDKKSLSPVDAAESLLSLSTTLPDKSIPFTAGNSFSHAKPSVSTMMLAPLPQPVKKESTGSKSTPIPRPSEISSSAAPTKIPLNPLEPAHPDGVAARAEVQKLARQVPSPYSNIMLPTIVQKTDGRSGLAKTALSMSSHGTSSIHAIQGSKGDKGEGIGKGTTLHPTPPTVDSLMERQKLEKGLQTPPRSTEKPAVETPEMKHMQLLSEDARIEAPNCGCLENDMDEAPYYTHLGTGPNLPAIRELVEKRSGFQGGQVRIEKVVYSGKEGKSSTGCPIAKWIIRRSSLDEKILVLVRHRPGHRCDTSYIIIAIVAWEGVDGYVADDTYEMLRTTLPNGAIPTVRRCGTNEDKTCACQGFSPDSCGASFTFGCSWSMYYNTCKFARSRTPRKFKLLESNPEVEDVLSDRFQNLATDLGPLYKRLAPESFNNQIAFEEEAGECRLGKEAGRPFAGVTACMDFCAHAHKDQHNMNNGCTVVVTLTKEDIRNKRPAPGDEQLHVLPLYYLDSTDEFGTAEGQQNKVRNGSIEVLTHYRHKIRVHGGDPVVPKGAMKSRNSSSSNSSPGRAKAASAAAAQAQRELEREREREKEKEREKEREREREREHEKRAAAAAASSSSSQKDVGGGHGIPKVEQPVPPHMNPQTMQMWPHYQQSLEALRAQWPGMEIPPGLVGGLRPESHHALMMMNGLHRDMLTPGGSIPPELAHMYAHYARFLSPGYVHPAMADIMLREQLQNNPAALARFMAPFGQDPYGGSSSNPYMHLAAQYGADIKPDPAMLNNPRLEGFYSPYLSPHLTSPQGREAGREGSHHPSDASKFPSPTLNGVRPDPHHPHTSQSHHPTSSSSATPSSTSSAQPHLPSSHSHKDGIWRPPIFQDSPKKESTSGGHHHGTNSSSRPPESRTPQKSPAYSPSVDKSIRPGDPRDPYIFRDDTPSSKPVHHHKSEGKSSKVKSEPHHFHQASHPERLTPHEGKDIKPTLPIPSLQDPANTPPPARTEEEYFSDSDKCFEDPTIGGVAIALTHGSVLFECAKRELHATTSILNPCRQRPTRISLVFYQHKRMTYKNHGLELYEKKMAARSLEQENSDSPSGKGKKKRPASTDDANKESAKKKKSEADKSQIPTKCAVTPSTNTTITLASYAFPTVTGPYQKWV